MTGEADESPAYRGRPARRPRPSRSGKQELAAELAPLRTAKEMALLTESLRLALAVIPICFEAGFCLLLGSMPTRARAHAGSGPAADAYPQDQRPLAAAA